MDFPISRTSSTEEDYREINEAALYDRLRDGLRARAEEKKPKHHHKLRHINNRDPELTRIATTASKETRVIPQRLADIDPRLDPEKDEFDFRFWATTFVQLVREDGIKRANVGVSFKSLTVSGMGSNLALQSTVATPWTSLARLPMLLNRHKHEPKVILHKLDGCVKSGEMLLVLGRPGSGCTTFLKSISGQLSGLTKSPSSTVSYDGISQDVLRQRFKGKAVYNDENDEHFPHLTVCQTLRFAAFAQTPQARIEGVDRLTQATHMAEVMMRIFGLSHVRDTKVGNDTIRGVSGGERKRVSIAEMALARSVLAVWDNSTRGLDSATALEFVRSLRTLADVAGVTQAVALYQASQHIYDTFDKVLVLYEGRQIFFGPIESARPYFERMGWYCPTRQTTPDFLTSITNPLERQPIPEFREKVPRTASDFEQYWLESEEFEACIADITKAEADAKDNSRLQALQDAHHAAQAHHTRATSPYLLSVWMQIRLCMKRCGHLLWNDRASTVSLAAGRVILALIIGSVYFGTSNTTASLQSRGAVIFLATLMNALMAVTEIGSLFGKRGIVQKQTNFAFYHPSADALAAFLLDIPVKFVISTLFNVVYYFLSGLRPKASNFFIFLLFNFICTLLMSAIFRSIGAASKQLTRAYATAGIGVLMMVIYTGFTLQTAYMHPWFRWINYINPIAYIFESLLVNEVHGRQFPCASQSLVPPYARGNSNFACAVIGAQPGERTVSGDLWVQSGYQYSYDHIWRNLGIAFAYMICFLAIHLAAVEFMSTIDAQPQRLIFRNRQAAQGAKRDVESDLHHETAPPLSSAMNKEDQGARPGTGRQAGKDEPDKVTGTAGVLTWEDVTLEIMLQDKPRRLLDDVTGWVDRGTLTCLMGVSGAGKTTLLDTLAQRQITTGKRSGNILVDGMPLQPSFQRRTGYVQQQDLHLPTSTVREALRFSALLRQPRSVSKEEKLAYVEHVIEILNMEQFSDAIVGRPGEGLNIEQRKLLTIGVELAAKPSILFLDEPTSGLDSQSAWTIVSLLRRLADNGQAVLATIHQPSAMLFQQFDSILLLAKGGRTSYFGPLGRDCQTLTQYFERHGAPSCAPEENPAEYILNTIGSPSSHDWPQIWLSSQECAATKQALRTMVARPAGAERGASSNDGEFALPFTIQFRHVAQRLFQNYWRNPGYIYAKLQFALLSALFIGFTFYLQNSSVTGMQNVIFAIYMLNATFSTMVNQVQSMPILCPASTLVLTLSTQIMSRFLPQRALFEVRESPSKMYSWVVFVLANILVEIPHQIFLSVVVWACWYFPVFGLHHDASTRAMMWAFCMQFLLFAATWAQMLIFVMPSTEIAGALSTILFTLTLQFNGVLQPPTALPGFWIFMYRVSPFTYLIGGWAGTGLADRPVVCAENELAIFDPPAGQTCGAYLSAYLDGGAPGSLLNPSALSECKYCPLRNANQFLAGSWIHPSDKYQNLGIIFAYIGFNIFAAVALYYVFRVRRFSVRSLRKTKPEGECSEKQRGGKHHKGRLLFYLEFYYHFALAVLRNVVR
jgi:ABC-type multidrug transport system ATPase subunit